MALKLSISELKDYLNDIIELNQKKLEIAEQKKSCEEKIPEVEKKFNEIRSQYGNKGIYFSKQKTKYRINLDAVKAFVGIFIFVGIVLFVFFKIYSKTHNAPVSDYIEVALIIDLALDCIICVPNIVQKENTWYIAPEYAEKFKNIQLEEKKNIEETEKERDKAISELKNEIIKFDEDTEKIENTIQQLFQKNVIPKQYHEMEWVIFIKLYIEDEENDCSCGLTECYDKIDFIQGFRKLNQGVDRIDSAMENFIEAAKYAIEEMQEEAERAAERMEEELRDNLERLERRCEWLEFKQHSETIHLCNEIRNNFLN